MRSKHVHFNAQCISTKKFFMAVSNVNNESINYHKRILSEAKVGVAFPNMRACIIIIIIIIKAKIIVTL